MTLNLDLKFIKPEKTDLAGPPHARVFIKNNSVDDKKLILITPDCLTIAEFDYEIVRLKKELDDIGKKAARKFKEARQNRSEKQLL